MKTTFILKSIIISIGLVFLFSSGSCSPDKKTVELKIKTSAVCGQCKDRIEQGMAYEKGIKDVVLDVETKIATVHYNPAKTTPADIRNSISKLGYDADEILADKTAYDKLPKCCKKDASKH
jgi:periplasmic mercuric ion binding protein